MEILAIFVEFLRNVGAASMGAVFMNVILNRDIDFWSVISAGIIGGFVWHFGESGLMRLVWRRISALSSSIKQNNIK